MKSFKTRLGNIIFEHDTAAAKLFDVVLLWAIVLSVVLVMLESVASFRLRYGGPLRGLEWLFTALFTLEYLLRLYTAYNRAKYIRSFYGVVDLLAILPSYLSLFLTGTQYFIVIRSLRLLRVFRVLKLVQFVGEASILTRALRASRAKIIVFLVTVVTLVIIIGSLMFLIEGPANGFHNIPVSVYWAIVTLTTVGYGDIAPKTPLGQFFSALVMILGYAIIAVPTGIVSVELSRAEKAAERTCTHCDNSHHDSDALYCKRCGKAL
ncbi:MAG: ion transporter [Trueperaceae bacterium]|nr:ion transporter [Trueperaceae bacterium]